MGAGPAEVPGTLEPSEGRLGTQPTPVLVPWVAEGDTSVL